MGKTGRFLHSPSSTEVVPVATAYNAANYATIHTIRKDINGNDQEFKGYIESLLFSVINIAGGASKITCRLCIDTGGNLSAVGDVEVGIDIGITTATTGTCQIYYDSFPFDNILGKDEIYVFFKCDAGTCDVNVTQLNWSE